METVSAKAASEIFRRPLSTLYHWASKYRVAEFDQRFGEKRFDLVGCYLLATDDRRSFRLYQDGRLSADRLSEVQKALGVGGLSSGNLVPIAIDPTAKVPVSLKARLIADAERMGRTPLDVLISTYAASVDARQ